MKAQIRTAHTLNRFDCRDSQLQSRRRGARTGRLRPRRRRPPPPRPAERIGKRVRTCQTHVPCLSVCLSVCLPLCPPGCLPGCLPACLPACLSVCLSVCVSLFLPPPSSGRGWNGGCDRQGSWRPGAGRGRRRASIALVLDSLPSFWECVGGRRCAREKCQPMLA